MVEFHFVPTPFLTTQNITHMIYVMGYRAPYLKESMKLLASLGGEQYLHILKYSTNDPIIVQEQLLQFMGIGRKVADCIALFSLNQCTAIPVEQQLHSLLRYATSVTVINNKEGQNKNNTNKNVLNGKTY